MQRRASTCMQGGAWPMQRNQVRSKRHEKARGGGVLAGPQGFEPRPTGPKPVVLPLDDGPTRPSAGPTNPIRVAQAGQACARHFLTWQGSTRRLAKSSRARPARVLPSVLAGPKPRPTPGEVPEWLNGTVSKTVVLLTRYRGFESHPLRQRVLRPPHGVAALYVSDSPARALEAPCHTKSSITP